MHPRDVLTPDDVRAAGFEVREASDSVDDTAAEVSYDAGREDRTWCLTLGVYLPADGHDQYWLDLLAAVRGDPPEQEPEWPAIGHAAFYVDGWLYLRWHGHLLWLAAEGPDPALARRVVERLARLACDRITPATRWPPPGEPAPPRPDVDSIVRELEALERLDVGTDRLEGVEPAAGTRPREGATLRPRVSVPGRYHRNHLANSALLVRDGSLVAIDARRRTHRFPLDGTDRAPAAIGTFVAAGRAGRLQLGVLDGRNRILVQDAHVDTWPLDDVRRFAREACLRWPAGGYLPAVDHASQPVSLDAQRAWPVVVTLLVAFASAIVLPTAGLPRWTAFVAPFSIVTLTMAYLAVAGTTRMSPKP